jgi:hypothetical protein
MKDGGGNYHYAFSRHLPAVGANEMGNKLCLLYTMCSAHAHNCRRVPFTCSQRLLVLCSYYVAGCSVGLMSRCNVIGSDRCLVVQA